MEAMDKVLVILSEMKEEAEKISEGYIRHTLAIIPFMEDDLMDAVHGSSYGPEGFFAFED